MLQILYLCRLVTGEHLRDDFRYARLLCHGLRGYQVVAREHHGADVQLGKFGTYLGCALLYGVRNAEDARCRTFFRHAYGGFTLRLHARYLPRKGGYVHAARGEKALLAHEHFPSFHLAEKSESGHVGHSLRGERRRAFLACRFTHRNCQGVGGRALQSGGYAQRVRPVLARKIGELGLAFGYSARLVEHHAVHARELLQRFRVLKEHSAARRPARARYDRRGSGEPQRAGAGDDEHRHEYLHTKRRRLTRRAPNYGGDDGDSHDHGHEYARYLVRKFGDGRLGILRVLHHLDYLGKGGIRTHALRAEGEGSAAVYRAAEHLVPGRFVHGHTLAREHTFIHFAAAGEDLPVAAKTLARLYEHHVARDHLLRGDENLLAAADDGGDLGRERGERGYGVARPLQGAVLQILAQGDERDDDGNRFKVEGMPQPFRAHTYAHIVIKAVYESGGGGYGDEAVHIRLELE